MLQRMAAENGDPAAVARELADLPGMVRFAATVNIAQPIHNLALELGRLIANQRSPKGQFIFLRESDRAVVTVDENNGDMQLMTPGRFVGWVEQFCAFTSAGRNRLREGLSRDDAGLVMDQDVFKDCLRPLKAVHKLRLPVLRQGELWELEFLSAGYDSVSRIFTCDLLPYPMDWTVDQAREFIVSVCSEMPWNGREDGPLEQNRSLSVHAAALVGNYCHALFPEGTLRPMIAYLANKPGTGKTRCAEMGLAHVWGFVGGTTAPKDEDKMDVKLETIARAMRPYVIFDDIGGSLRSNALNKFLTESRHTGRCYNSNSEFFDVPNVTQLIVTANDLTTSEDLGRRALIAELFLDEEVRGRQFKQVISPDWLASDETRAKFLAACCAIVRHWEQPTNDERRMPRHSFPLETFDIWTGIVGAMVMLAGFGDPLKAPEMDVGGASVEDEIKQLLIIIATERDGDTVVSRKEMVETAREHGLIERVVGAKGDSDPDEKMTKSFGRQMQRWRGQKLKTVDGRRFVFGHKRMWRAKPGWIIAA